jgi:glucokinase
MLGTSIKTKVLGVDIGCERTLFAVVDVRGNILAKDEIRMDTVPGVNEFVSVLCERMQSLVDEHGGYENIRSLGISAPSGNYMTGNIENSGNLPWKGQIPLAAMMRDRLGLAVCVANDAHARAMGEWTYGCAHGMKDFIFLMLGYGLGSCLFSNGHVHLGANGFAGEIGHCCVYAHGRQCSCGSLGCLESYCASRGVIQTAQELMDENTCPSLMRGVENLTPEMITDFCEQGDELAIEVYRKTGFILGIGMANYASVINPEAIIIGGGIAGAGHWLIDPANESFEQHVFHNISNKVKIIPSVLSDEERNVLGASALAWDVKEYSLFK